MRSEKVHCVSKLSPPMIVLLLFPVCGSGLWSEAVFRSAVTLQSCTMIIPCQKTPVFCEISQEGLLQLLLRYKCSHLQSTRRRNCLTFTKIPRNCEHICSIDRSLKITFLKRRTSLFLPLQNKFSPLQAQCF